MIGLPFMTALFKNILGQSRGIQGRFFYCPKMGAEINMADFDQVITDQFSKPDKQQAYPANFMMPPVSRGVFTDPRGEWEQYEITSFFLSTSYYGADGRPRDPNQATGTSTHSIMMDQHDMGRCARNFIAVLNQLCRNRANPLITNKLRIVDSPPKRIVPVAFVGTSVLSGVRLDFACSVFNGCTIEDYSENQIFIIAIPEDDPHPEHKL